MDKLDEYVDYMKSIGYFSEFGNKGGKIHINSYTKTGDKIVIYVSWGMGENLRVASVETTISDFMALKKVLREEKINELLKCSK